MGHEDNLVDFLRLEDLLEPAFAAPAETVSHCTDT